MTDERDELRSLLIEADSFISHMLHRHSWPGERRDVESLIGRLRSAAKSLVPVVSCGEVFAFRSGGTLYTTTCELPQGHVGAHSFMSQGFDDPFVHAAGGGDT